MRSWLNQTAEVWRLLRQLRPYLGAGRGLLFAALASSLVMVLFEGVGVGLLVPLLSLLLGGSHAVPMRPLQWLERELPNHSPAFYVGGCCVAIVAAIAAKNVASYVAQLFAARLKQRVSIGLRQALFRRTGPYFNDYFRPSVPPTRRLVAQCGWNAVDTEDVQRLLIAAAGRLSATQAGASSPFTRQG